MYNVADILWVLYVVQVMLFNVLYRIIIFVIKSYRTNVENRVSS